MNRQRGFTLIEVVAVITVMLIVTFFMLRNFGRNRIHLEGAANNVLADVRAMEAKTLSGTRYNNQVRCGYGIERASSTTYRLYVGPLPSATTNCTSYNRNFNSGGGQADTSIQVKGLTDSRLEFKNNFNDIFFEPPEPKVFLNNSYSLSSSPIRITVGNIGQNCNNNRCKSVCVYPSGRVELVPGNSCP